MRRVAITLAVLSLGGLGACGGGEKPSAESGGAGSAAAVKQSGLMDPNKLFACFQDVGGKPARSTDNQLYSALVQDPDFRISYDAWRGNSFPAGYASIYTWVFRTAEGARRAMAAQSENPDFGNLADGLRQVDNVLWTTDMGDAPPEQQQLVEGCFTRART